jgi:hypothetical protein
MGRVPHVRPGVRGTKKTGEAQQTLYPVTEKGPPGAPHPRFPVKCRGFRELHAPFLKERRTHGPVRFRAQEIRGISLVFREMWDTTAPHPQCSLCSRLRVTSEPITANPVYPYRGIFRNSAGAKARRVNRASRIAPLK